jgi:NTP pyrophosphatase (non-canonical NTP hydrolase)
MTHRVNAALLKLAEEAAELSQAATKLNRIRSGLSKARSSPAAYRRLLDEHEDVESAMRKLKRALRRSKKHGKKARTIRH